MNDTPKKGTRGPRGKWGPYNEENQSPIANKKLSKETWEKKYKPRLTLKQAQELAQEMGAKKDLAADIAHACFAGNMDRIYEAFSRGLLKGDPRVFQTLANRAYGVPQEQQLEAGKTFKLIIESIGEPVAETITVHPDGRGGGGVAQSPEHMARMLEKSTQQRLLKAKEDERTQDQPAT